MHESFSLERSAPEAQGIDSAAILAFARAAERAGIALHSLMLLRHGAVGALLLPAMHPRALPADPGAAAELGAALGALRLPLQDGAADSPLAAGISGRTYRFAPNPLAVETMRLDFDGAGCVWTVSDARGTHQAAAGWGEERYGETTIDPGGPQVIAGSGGWVADDCYRMRLVFYETPFARRSPGASPATACPASTASMCRSARRSCRSCAGQSSLMRPQPRPSNRLAPQPDSAGASDAAGRPGHGVPQKSALGLPPGGRS